MKQHLFGWCSPTDQYHDLCKVQYSRDGNTTRCSCPNHPENAEESA